MLIGFTCKVCNHRQYKTMSKNAYERGVVLMQCDGCKSRHLIADNKGWFRDKSVNIEELMAERGEDIRKLMDLGLLDNIEAGQAHKALADYDDIVARRNSGPNVTPSSNPPEVVDPVENRRRIRRATQSSERPLALATDISPTPTKVVRLSCLPPGTTAVDIRCVIATQALAKRIKSLTFEYDFNLRPLQSCRVVFFSQEDSAAFAVRSNKMAFAGNTIRADFVIKEVVPNATTEAYLGNALGRLVFLYGYPPHMNEYQIRDYYREYDIVDTTLPGVQRAPQMGNNFLVRRGAFIVQLSTPSEAQRFVRDVYNSEYLYRDNPDNEQPADRDVPLTAEKSPPRRKHTIKAIILQ
ncbi:hypothetical protein EV174_003105 [Coemansia sp. RSA 2320]|nr:hypothetical protein EV174_003105 [Coemansia sp. RSA 2320]